jgi:hypothetical protein
MPTLNERIGDVVKMKRPRDRAAQPDRRDFSEANRERNAFVGLYDALTPEHQTMVRAFMLFLREQQNDADESS